MATQWRGPRERERQTNRHTERGRGRERERQTQREGETERERETDRETDTERQTDRQKGGGGAVTCCRTLVSLVRVRDCNGGGQSVIRLMSAGPVSGSSHQSQSHNTNAPYRRLFCSTGCNLQTVTLLVSVCDVQVGRQPSTNTHPPLPLNCPPLSLFVKA